MSQSFEVLVVGLLGDEDDAEIRPAVERARSNGAFDAVEVVAQMAQSDVTRLDRDQQLSNATTGRRTL